MFPKRIDFDTFNLIKYLFNYSISLAFLQQQQTTIVTVPVSIKKDCQKTILKVKLLSTCHFKCHFKIEILIVYII